MPVLYQQQPLAIHTYTPAWPPEGRYAHRQKGQAMVFVVVTASILLLALMVMYSTGQITTQRTKLQNTADAVAYSLAVVQARDLNFSSYINRAMIANQVAVGQLISITSWTRNYNESFNGPFAKVAEVFANMSSLSALWTVPARVHKVFSRQLNRVVNRLAPPLVKGIDILINALYLAASGYHIASAANLGQTADEVLEANDPQARFSTLGSVALATNVLRHLTFASVTTNPTNRRDGEDRFAQVVDASSDVFYKNRSLPPIWPTPLLIDPLRLVTYGPGPLLMFVSHGGGSKMPSNTKSYAGVDASGLFMIFCVTIPVLGIPVPICFPIPLPLGYGAAAAGTYNGNQVLAPGRYIQHRNPSNTGVDPLARIDYGGVYINPITVVPYAIQYGKGPGRNLDRRAGLTRYVELKDNINRRTSNQAVADADESNSRNYHNHIAPPFVVEVERDSSSVPTATSTFKLGGDLELPDGTSNGKLRALSKAEAYFYRPPDLFPRADSRFEYGSLYSPYWQAHLTQNSILEQGASILGTVLVR